MNLRGSLQPQPGRRIIRACRIEQDNGSWRYPPSRCDLQRPS